MEPTISGTRGRAWDGRAFPAAPNPQPDWQGCCGQYVVNVPGAHPLWQWWMVSTVHLREIDGVKPPHLQRPTATHEFIILSMNPEIGSPEQQFDRYHQWLDEVRDSKRSIYLSPPDLVFQVDGCTDEIAGEICTLLVRTFCAGGSSPDSDFRRYNEQLILGTLDHMRQGKYLPQ